MVRIRGCCCDSQLSHSQLRKSPRELSKSLFLQVKGQFRLKTIRLAVPMGLIIDFLNDTQKEPILHSDEDVDH